MKHLFNSLLLALIGTALYASDSRPMHEAKRNFTQTYTLTGNEEIRINNQFGDTEFKIWNKSEIKVDAEIRVETNSERSTQRLMDEIDIRHSNRSGTIYFKTDIDNDNHKNDSKGKTEMSIDYVVYLPNNYEMEIEQSFGDVILPDYDGTLEIEVQFGDLIAGQLSSIDDLHVQYGSIDIEKAQDTRMELEFSKIKNLTISGDIELNLSFCNNSDINIDGSITDLEINASYSDIDIFVDQSASVSFDIATSFGGFTNRSDINIDDTSKSKSDWGPTFDHNYRGSFNGGKAQVDIEGSFSSITIRD